jgi:hypothetical protein
MSFVGDLLGGIGDVVGGISGANKTGDLADQLGGIADPLMGYQSGFADSINNLLTGDASNQAYGALSGVGGKLSNLIANPDSVTQTQQYQSSLGQGLGAANQAMSAQGLTGSGAQLLGLSNYAGSKADSAYNTQLGQLSGLYGQQLGGMNQQFQNLLGGAQAGTGNAVSAISSLMGQQNKQSQQAGSGLGSLLGLGLSFL